MGGMDPLGKSQSSSVAKVVFLVNARKPTWGAPRWDPVQTFLRHLEMDPEIKARRAADASAFQPAVGQKGITPLQNFTISPLLRFLSPPLFSPPSLLVVKSIKLSVSLTELHHLAAVKAKQTR